MLLLKQNGFYVIQNSKGQYYTLLKNGKPDVTNALQNAYKWRRKDRAENYLANIPQNSDFQVQFVEDNKESAIQDILRQIEKDNGGRFPASAATIYGKIKHYAKGTRNAEGGVSQVNENGLETLMKQTP